MSSNSPDFTQEQWQTIITYDFICSLASLFGIGFMIVAYINFETLRATPRFKLAFYLSMADLCWGINGVLVYADLHLHYGPDYCIFNSLTFYYSYLASFFWTAIFAFYVYKLAEDEEPDLRGLMRRYEKLGRLVGFGLPGVFSLAIVLGFGTETDSIACSLGGELQNGSYMTRDIITLFLPYSLTVIFNLTCFVKAMRLFNIRYPMQAKKMIWELVPYPTILILTWFGLVVNFLDYDIHGFYYSYDGFILSLSLAKLQGFLNSIAYGLDFLIRAGYISALWKRFKCKKRSIALLTEQSERSEQSEQSEQSECQSPQLMTSNLIIENI